MEKIKEALEKARLAVPKQLKRSDSSVFDLSSSKKTVAQIDDSDMHEISYESTRVVELDPAHLEKNRIVCFGKSDPAAWVFDSLRTQILQKMDDNGWQTIAVVSPTPESGKTLVSINLAISIANQPQKTAMLVDFDLRRPKIAQYLGLKLDKSINDYISSNTPIAEMLINPGMPRLVVLPTKSGITNSAEVLSSSKMQGLMQEIKSRYESRIVIFDLPPLLNADDALVILPKVDCVLLVVGNGLVKEAEIEEAMHYIPKEKLIGIVLNKAEVDTTTYY